MPNRDNDSISRFPEPFEKGKQIQYIQGKKTNFIFLFGRHQAGKTAITASLIHYLSAISDYGNLDRVGNKEGKRLAERIRYAIGQGRFPDRTRVGSVTEVDCCFVPHQQNRHLEEFWFTFLEMSGEDLKQVDLHDEDTSGELPDNIDVFFEAEGISMTFILVTPQDEARKDDDLMVNFLDYLYEKSPDFRESRVLLLVSKWDQHMGGDDIREFLRSEMPNTFRKISRNTNAARAFSLGRLSRKLVDGLPYIQKYDPEPAQKVFEWLYESLTGKKITTKWDKFKKWF